jgi:carboxymethylenebutenolidase
MTGKLEVVTEHIRLAAEGSLDFNAFYARPRAGSGVGLILLHDMFGPSRVFEELAEEYAAKGCCVLLPNLFWRHAGPAVIGYDGHAVAGPREVAFDSDMAALDLRIAADWLRTAPGCSGKIVVWGFCFSGRLAYLAAAR